MILRNSYPHYFLQGLVIWIYIVWSSTPLISHRIVQRESTIQWAEKKRLRWFCGSWTFRFDHFLLIFKSIRNQKVFCVFVPVPTFIIYRDTHQNCFTMAPCWARPKLNRRGAKCSMLLKQLYPKDIIAAQMQSCDCLRDLLVVKPEVTTHQNKTFQAIFSPLSLYLVRLSIVPNDTLLFWRKDLQRIFQCFKSCWGWWGWSWGYSRCSRWGTGTQLMRVFFILEIVPRILHLFVLKGWR